MAVRSDGELVRAGSTEELVRRWASRVVAFCHARTGSAQAAEDLAQESLMRALKGLKTLEEPERFGSWVFGIAHRVCLDWVNGRRREPVALTADHEQPSPIDQSQVDRADDVRSLMSEVEALPEDYREVLMLYYYNDVRYEDLARMLGVSSATINMRLTKARQMLRMRMKARRP